MAAKSTKDAAVPAVVARLTAAAKYRDVHPDTIAEVVRRESAATTNPAELERLSRARLHKVAALHLLTTRPAALRRAVAEVDASDPAALRAWCRAVLGGHVSTAERLPDLDRFYPTVFELVPRPRTVIDVACALNVFTLPWLREATAAPYTGYDLNATFVAAGNAFTDRFFPDSAVVHDDVLTTPPPHADLALLLKTYHCIEDRRRGAGLALVDELAADHIVVSFPTRAMNGRAAVFVRRHVDALAELAGQRKWRFATAELPSELLVAVGKG
jgi:16S rRNA (guanine(1405)-N(7))-methyltransferase